LLGILDESGWRQNAVGADALGKLQQERLVKDTTRVGRGFVQQEQRTLRYSVAFNT
jgi:hypothetical protein